MNFKIELLETQIFPCAKDTRVWSVKLEMFAFNIRYTTRTYKDGTE
ncbi:hypothetical protein LEP1GSC163_1123 [Leptospira santarosai str. CBC379]|nr:hypothetical protein LEP1GSC163_1123 [Leptospira santarosai str. CBC379]